MSNKHSIGSGVGALTGNRLTRRTFLRSAVATAGMVGLGSSLAACGDEGSTAGGSVTLQFMRPGAEDTIKSIFQPLLDQFVKENPEVTIEPLYMGFDEAYQRMPLLAATGKLPDLFLAPGQLFPVLADEGTVLPLEEEMGSDFDAIRADIPGTALDAVTVDGKGLGVPAVIGPLGLWINTDLFEQAGLDPAAPPETWDDFLVAAQALQANTDAYPVAINAFPRNDATDELAAIYASLTGESYWDTENGRVKVDDPAFLGALEMMRSWVDAGLTNPNVGAISNDDVRILFRDGDAAMMFSTCSGSVSALEGGAATYVSAKMPRDPSLPESVTAMSLDSWGINARSENVEMAIKLLQFMTTPENVTSPADNYGTIPPSKEVLASNDTYTSGIWPPFVEMLDHAVLAKPVQPDMALVSTEIPMMLQSALTQSTPQDALSAFANDQGW